MPVAEYQKAFREHQAAKKAASEAVQSIYNISNAISRDLRSFIGWQFGPDIGGSRTRYDPKAQVDLATWPTADQLGEKLKTWNEADTALRQAWKALSEDERIGLSSPPQTMQLDASRY